MERTLVEISPILFKRQLIIETNGIEKLNIAN